MPPLSGFLALLATAAAVQLPTILPWGANSFRIQYSPSGIPITNSTYSPFLDAPLSTSPFTVSSSGNSYSNGNLRIDVDPSTGLLNATRISDGFVVAQMSSLTFGPPVSRGRYPSAQMEFLGHANGESLFGMGEQGTTGRVTLEQPFNRVFTDTEYYAFNQGRQAFFPWYLSSAGYGMMLAQPGYGWLRVDVAPYFSAYNASSSETIDFWLTTTPGNPVYAVDTPHPFLPILAQFADAVGYAPPMPAFAAGFIASKDRYRNQTQFMEVAHGYVDRGIPISMLTVDWFHWEHLGDMSLNPSCWPDPQAMVDECRELGIEVMITHWPFMQKESVHRAEYEAAGALAINSSSGVADTFWEYLQEGSLITTLSESTRNLTKKKWFDGYGRFGVKAMWLDETEPDRTGPSNDLLVNGVWEYEGVSATEVGPTWRQQWIRTMTDTLRELHGVGNYFLLSRSAWLGTAKYGHAIWSGDTESSWEAFAQQIPTGLGAGLSGLGLWANDLGGYSATMQPFDPKLEELLVRWAQFSSVSPLMRLHGHRNGGPPSDPVCMQTNGDNEPWSLFKDGVTGTNYQAFVSAIKWRDQMRNYVVDTQLVWSQKNIPMIRPMWLEFPGEAAYAFSPDGSDNANAEGAFMFGDSWLAKPITTYGQVSEWVWLPKLTNGTWVFWFGQKNYGSGGINVTLDTPVDVFPLFYIQRVQ